MTEQQSNKPITAAEAFEAAGENLRLAEVGWSDTRVPTDRVARVIDIANAWTALGVGLANAEPFDAKYPIPIKLVGEPLEPVIGTMQEFNLGEPGGDHFHHFAPEGGQCSWCSETTDPPRPGLKRCTCGYPVRDYVAWREHVERRRTFVGDRIGQQCLSPWPPTAHEHSHPLCGHTWVRPMEPCANGCGARPEEGRSHLPCPKTCPDVTA